ncbi:MAG: hypothetical protein H6653_19325 [Ardenticatenaceae bacterium]|nr:hypothetical protein [Ardenticatenaceae bacterium]
MNKNKTSKDWNFGIYWMVCSMLGLSIGCIAGWFIVVVVFWTIFPDNIFPFIALGGAIAGTSVGLAQWQAIRLKAPHANKLTWLAGNIVGMAISWVFFYWLISHFEDYRVMAFLVTVIAGTWGVLSATLQWHALQGQIRRPAIWVALSGLCGILVFAVGWIWVPILNIGYMSNSGSDVSGFFILSFVLSIFSWPIAGSLYGFTTGSLLTWLQAPSNRQDELNRHILAE